MSKKKAKRKKNNIPKKKKRDIKTPLILLAVVTAVGLLIGGIYLHYRLTSLECTDFADTHYTSVSAYDATGDEANLKDIYNNRYDDYRGTLDLMCDGSFNFWMTVGDANDGTHKGTYTYDRPTDTINAVFDNGDKADFKIIRGKDGAIQHIEAPYKEYTIYFEKAPDSY